MNKWYSIRRIAATAAAAAALAAGTAEATTAEIWIYGDIGESWWGESVTASSFVKELAAIDADTINVRINSYGGSVPDGLAIHNALKRHKATINVTIDGIAASIASLIAMAGDRVEISENAMLMVHAPWSYAVGNSTELREQADMLDMWAKSMGASYASKTGRDLDDVMAWLTDGKDHWFGADDAVSEGLADAKVEAIPVAASATKHSWVQGAKRPSPAAAHKPTLPAAAAAPTPENPMTVQVTNPPAAPDAQAAQQAAVVEAAVRAENQRTTDIRAAFEPHLQLTAATQLLAKCLGDTKCTVAEAKAQLLDVIAKGATPAGGSVIETTEDERDKFRAAAAQSIMARGMVRAKDGKVVVAETSNPYRGHKLLDLARASLERSGIKTAGMSQMELVAAAFTQTTSDFPILLENTMHKVLQAAYALQADTWTRFCKRGSVSDFRAHNRYRVGSLSNLESLTEAGEFRNKAIPDGEKASIKAGTKGNIINISRQAVVNDDLDALTGMAEALGRAAKRTVEADVYALLNSNPTLADGVALFHANHGNLAATPAAPTVASFDAARVAMASQKDPSGNDFLSLTPAVWLGPSSLGGTVRVLNNAEYDPDTANKLQRPNMVRGMVRDIVDTPRLSSTAWYVFADKDEAPVIEVVFLDGIAEPFLELENGFTVDGARWKGRLDFGVGAVDYRGAQKNAGA